MTDISSIQITWLFARTVINDGAFLSRLKIQTIKRITDDALDNIHQSKFAKWWYKSSTWPDPRMGELFKDFVMSDSYEGHLIQLGLLTKNHPYIPIPSIDDNDNSEAHNILRPLVQVASRSSLTTITISPRVARYVTLIHEHRNIVRDLRLTDDAVLLLARAELEHDDQYT